METEKDFDNKTNTTDTEKVTHKKLMSITLDEVEILTFKNINLQRRILNMELQEVNKQETLIANNIKQRTGVDISNWNVDISTGVCTPREKTSGL